jgi:large subunit ribosomal protein L24
MARIRKGDMIEVIGGNDRGKRGQVLKVIPDNDRVVVQGINLRWKHLRKSQQSPQGGRVKREVAIHISNVMVFDAEAGERTRVGYQGAGKEKIRVGRKTGKELGAVVKAPEKATKKKKQKKDDE